MTKALSHEYYGTTQHKSSKKFIRKLFDHLKNHHQIPPIEKLRNKLLNTLFCILPLDIF